MSISSISAVSTAASTACPATSTSEVTSPDGSTVTVVRDTHKNILSIAATPATRPASAIAEATNQATGTAGAPIHLTA